MPAGLQRLIKRVMALYPVRVVMLFGQKNGPLLANGLSFTALFSVFAALYVGFAVFGFVLQGNVGLQRTITGFLTTSLPGLFGEGGLDPDDLLDLNGVFGGSDVLAVVFGVVAALIAVNTALNWFGSFRIASRSLAELEQPKANIVLLKLKDLLVVIGFGIALLISFALLFISNGLLGTVLGSVGIADDSFIGSSALQIATLAVMLAFDTVVVGALYRIVSGFAVPLKHLIPAALFGAVGLEVLKYLGSSLLGGASSNPLIATFAIPVGLLLWFNLICQVLLIGAAWIAVGIADRETRAERLDARAKAGAKLRRGGSVRWARGPASAAEPHRPALKSSERGTVEAPTRAETEPEGFWARLRARVSR